LSPPLRLCYSVEKRVNTWYNASVLSPDQFPETPEGLFSGDTFIRYTFDGVEKRGAWLSLSNGMRLVVTIPVDETDGDWQTLIREIIIASLEVLLILSLFTMYYTSRITKPLEELTSAAEKVDRGNYDFTLDYCEDDEVGRLTSTFKRLSDHMKDHISDLNKRVYVDALTSVKNKGAFTAAVEGIQSQMDTHCHGNRGIRPGTRQKRAGCRAAGRWDHVFQQAEPKGTSGSVKKK